MKDYNANIVLSTMGTAFGLSVIDIQNILGLVLTAINLLVLLISLGLKFYKYIKNDGKLDKQEISDLLSDAKEIKKELDSIEKEHKNGSL